MNVAQLLTLHIGEYLLANQKGEFTIIGSDEFDTAYEIIRSYSMED